jgi:MFS family permease
MAYCSLRVSDRLVMRIGIRVPLATGLGLVAVSLALFAFAPVGGEYVVDVLPAMVLLGLGAGIAFNPVLLAAMGDVEPHEAGLASGVVNTSFMMGGALGLAILVAVSSWWTGGQPDPTSLESLHGGFQVAFAVGAVFAAAAAAIGGAYLRPKPMVVPDAETGDQVAVPVPSEPNPLGCGQTRLSPVSPGLSPHRQCNTANATAVRCGQPVQALTRAARSWRSFTVS